MPDSMDFGSRAPSDVSTASEGALGRPVAPLVPKPTAKKWRWVVRETFKAHWHTQMVTFQRGRVLTDAEGEALKKMGCPVGRDSE